MNNFSQKYQNLNNSFEKTCCFHVGVDQGLFSEINCMVMAILYCLQNKIKFILYSDDANFANKKGWEEFFLPFCPQSHIIANDSYNPRHESDISNRKNFWFLLGKNFNRFILKINFNFLTYDIFFKTEPIYNIPELNIYSENWVDAGKSIAKMLWRFNDDTKKEIDNIIKSLNLPNDYIGIQIRRGDKMELEKQVTPPLDNYIKIIEQISNIKTILVFCDDYNDFLYLKNKYTEYHFITTCKEHEKGYDNISFQKRPWKNKKNALLNLLSNIEMISKANYAVMTSIANPFYFIKMLMDKEKFYEIEKIVKQD